MAAKVAPVTDMVVVLPGIMGSTLAQDGRIRSSETPAHRSYRQVGDDQPAVKG
jgi:hypothetical protein